MPKRIIAVGGAGAVGRAFTSHMEAQGHAVFVLDLAASIETAGMRARAHVCDIDVSSASSVAQAVESVAAQWEAIDALVYFSGYTLSPPRPLLAVEDEEWCAVIDVNLSGAFRAAKAFHPLLDQNGGSIVLVSSSMFYNPVKGFAPYIASKAGMIGLTRALAIEFGPTIRVNALAPSAMETPFLAGGSGRVPADTTAEWFLPDNFVPTIPLGRLAEVEDCVGPLEFLISDSSAFMTGQVVHINGGRAMV